MRMRDMVNDDSESSEDKEEESSDPSEDERWFAPTRAPRVQSNSKLMGAFVNTASFYT